MINKIQYCDHNLHTQRCPICELEKEVENLRLAQIEDSAQHSFEVRLLTEERNEARSALIAVADKNCPNWRTCDCDSCVRSRKASGIDTANKTDESRTAPVRTPQSAGSVKGDE